IDAAVDDDAARRDALEAGQRAQQCRFAGAVRSGHGEELTVGGLEGRAQREVSDAYVDIRVEVHGCRRASVTALRPTTTRTPIETMRRIRLSAVAARGSLSSVT